MTLASSPTGTETTPPAAWKAGLEVFLRALFAWIAPEAHADLRQQIENALKLARPSGAAGHQEPPRFDVQHLGQSWFNPADLCRQPQDHLRRLLPLEWRLTADLLDALCCRAVDSEIYQALLVEQGVRIGQLYAELARRSWVWCALALLEWEVRLLSYRWSSAVAPLLSPLMGR